MAITARNATAGPAAAPLPWWLALKPRALPVIINSGLGDNRGHPLDEGELRAFVATALARLRSTLTEGQILDPFVLTEEDAEADLARLRAAVQRDVDVLLPITAGIVYNQGWRHSTPLEIRLREFDLPVLRLGYMVWDFLGLETVAALRHYGKQAYFAASAAEADQYLRMLRVRKALARTRIARFEEPPPVDWRPSGAVHDPAVVKERLGVQMEYFPLTQLRTTAYALPDTLVQQEAQAWIRGAVDITPIFRPEELNEEYIETAARLHLAIKETVEAGGFTAVSGCSRPGQIMDHRSPPCFSFVKLKDEGIPAGCEADNCALLAMIVLMYLSGKPADMGNTLIPTYTDDHMEDWQIPNPDENTIIISHSVTPTRMAGFGQPPLPYSFRGVHCSTCYATNSYVELPAGQAVTVGRMGPRLDRMLIAEGTIVATHMTPAEGNRNAVYIRVRDRRDLFRKMADFGNHLTFVYGRHADDAGLLCESLGIEPVYA